MWQFLAEGRDPQQRAKLTLESDRQYRVGRSPECEIPVPWEQFLSRQHFTVAISKESVEVCRISQGRNPIFFEGEPRDRFTLQAGQRFVVGETSFLLRELQPLSPQLEAPIQEFTFSPGELEGVEFEDADRRLEALARLPAIIGTSLSDEEKAAQLAGLILAGIRHAEAVAVVSSDQRDDVQVTAWVRRNETHGPFRPSVGLVRDAMHQWRTMLHLWEKSQDQPDTLTYTVPAEFDWAFCTPVGKFAGQSWGIYVAGKLDQPLSESHPLRKNLQSDVRFTQLIGDVLSSAERMNRMEGQLSILRQFLSPPILHALEQSSSRPGELNSDLLQPKVCDVTVLFCDLRGFSQRAEESIGDLQGLLSRVNAALEVMTRAILEHGGVTGDFLGDAVLGFWGWPFSSEDAPLKACRAALDIRRQFTKMHSSKKHPLADFRVGVGVAHGRAIAGKIGTGGRVTVTVFGPVVNLSSRLEGMTKRLRVPVILDEATARIAKAGLSADEGRVRQLATVQPYGLDTPLTVSELVPPFGEYSDLNDDQLATFERGVDEFRAGRWEEAYRAFHEVPSSDHAQDFLLSLITQHNRLAPAGWRGVIELPGK
ncbi:adenylate/guanylate cyclase domain-containing protein [Planctomicrobium sp. SH664]|uniref:adenylate/guanylate cyclase domain-containing protein n=1 Tax=Planctomicrobium sp. SH664 TaxID=3448125 RepID=UPI003F5BC371